MLTRLYVRSMMVARPQLSMLAFQQRGIKSMDDRQAEKEQAAFQEEIKDFLNKDSFNLFDFHERVMVSQHTHPDYNEAVFYYRKA